MKYNFTLSMFLKNINCGGINMEYNKFINYVEMGHEFIGIIDNKELKILNIMDDKVTVIIESKAKHYDYENIRYVKIYNKMTFKELIELELIKIYEIY